MRTCEYYIKPSSGEILSAEISLPPESGAIITGTVLTPSHQVVPEALVLLLDRETGNLIGNTQTDEFGHFYLGPVPADTLYIVRVQLQGQHTRPIELNV